MTLQDRGIAMKNRLQPAAAGVAITYFRGPNPGVEIAGAIVGFGADETTAPAGGKARLDWAKREYLIPREKLILDGDPAEPRPGDRIEQTVNGVCLRFEVAPRGDGSCWRWSDEETQTRYRVYTVQV